MKTQKLLERPIQIVRAQKVLYLVIVIGVVRTIMTVVRHADVRSPNFLIIMKSLIYVFSFFLIYELGKAKNWAKWSLVVILTVSIPLVVLPTFDAISHNPIHSFLGLLSLGLYIVALVFLFHKSSSAWFNK